MRFSRKQPKINLIDVEDSKLVTDSIFEPYYEESNQEIVQERSPGKESGIRDTNSTRDAEWVMTCMHLSCDSLAAIQWFSPFDQPKFVAATVHKKRKTEQVGVTIRKLKKRDGIYISKIHRFGKLASEKLRVGMKIVSLNGIPCPQTVEETLYLLKEAKGDLKIVAEYPESPKK